MYAPRAHLRKGTLRPHYYYYYHYISDMQSSMSLQTGSLPLTATIFKTPLFRFFWDGGGDSKMTAWPLAGPGLPSSS